jgi:hypothetical protein
MVGASPRLFRPSGGADFFSEEPARRSGISLCMATIMERALTWPVTLPRVISGVPDWRFPSAGQDLFAAQVQPAQSLGFLLDELLLHGGTVLYTDCETALLRREERWEPIKNPVTAGYL